MTKKMSKMATQPIFAREEDQHRGISAVHESRNVQKKCYATSLSNFDFLLIYKADLAGLRTYPFINF